MSLCPPVLLFMFEMGVYITIILSLYHHLILNLRTGGKRGRDIVFLVHEVSD